MMFPLLTAALSIAFPAASPPVMASVLASLPALHVRGKEFVDASGTVHRLRGINLGGWLVEEIWMTPWADTPPAGSSLPKIPDHDRLWGTIETRLGRESMVRIRNAWRDDWITDADFDRIRAAGFDHVRLPFLDSLLDEPSGMEVLHSAVRRAAAHGLYTVLDMHGAPGGQSNEHHTGREGRNRLWFDVENIDRMETDWVRLAREFGSDPNVIMFDLMNEPMGAPNPAMLNLVFDRVMRAIRPVAPQMVLMVEDGYKGFETTPHPNLAKWTQLCYSLHFYNFDAKAPEDHVKALRANRPKTAELQGYRDTPLYIGEFNLEPHGTPAAMHDYVHELTDAGWSWAMWTYKTDAKGGPMGQWGLYRRAHPAAPLNPYTDSEAELIRKIRGVRTENFEAVPGLINALKE